MQVEVTVPGPDAIGVVLLPAQEKRRSIVEMGDGDLLSPKFSHALQGAAAAKNVEGIEDRRRPGMIGQCEHIKGGLDGAVLFHKSEELEGGQNADAPAQDQQFVIPFGAAQGIRHAGGRSGNDVGLSLIHI